MISGIKINKKKIIEDNYGSVMHIMNNKDKNYKGFGEVYFSTINYKIVKGWKRHKKMTMNIVVPIGEIKFVFFDDRKKSNSVNSFFEITLSQNNYKILTVPPRIWFSFQGLNKKNNLLLNFSNIKYINNEIEKKNLSFIKYKW